MSMSVSERLKQAYDKIAKLEADNTALRALLQEIVHIKWGWDGEDNTTLDILYHVWRD